MIIRLKLISFIALTLSIGCSVDTIDSSSEEDVQVILDENDFLDVEQRESLQDVQPTPPPYAKPRGVYECIREYPEIDLCSWKQTPDVILLGYLQSAKPVDAFYKINFGAEDLGPVDHCALGSQVSYSVEMGIQTAVILKNQSGLDENTLQNINVIIDSYFLGQWRSSRVVKENITLEKDFAFDGVFKEGQLLGVSLFQHDGVFSVGHTPLFILDPQNDEVIFQKIDSCLSMTPTGWQGLPVDEFISTLNKCDHVMGQDTHELREHQLGEINQPEYGHNVCF